MLYSRPLMVRKKIQLILLVAVYLVTIFLGTNGVYVCISEQEHAQIEFLATGCKNQQQQIRPDLPILTRSDCGDCSDYALTGIHLTSLRGMDRVLHHKSIVAVETTTAAALNSAFQIVGNRFADGQNHLFASLRSTVLII